MLRIFLFTIFLITGCCSFGQLQQQYLFTSIGPRKGLASDETNEVQQDEKGFIWVGTTNGLQRYDGRRFLSFRHSGNDPFSIPNDEVSCLEMQKNNRLWLLCAGNRVGYFNVLNFRFQEVPVRISKDILNKSFGNLVADNNGNIMLVLNGSTFLTYNEKSAEFSTANNLFQLPVNWKPAAISTDKNDNYWIACDSGLVKYNAGKKKVSYKEHNTEQDEIINAFGSFKNLSYTHIDRSGRAWVITALPGTNNSLYSFDPATKSVSNWSSPLAGRLNNALYEIYAIKEQRDGTIWAFGNNLFAHFNENNRGFEYIQSNLPGEFSMRYDVVVSLFEDRENSLWASTNRGLYRFNPGAQVYRKLAVSRNDGLVAKSDVTNILPTKNGIIISTLGNGMFSYDRNYMPLQDDYSSQFQRSGERIVLSVCQRSNGDIWTGDQGGSISVYRQDTRKLEILRPPAFEGSTIHQIIEDRNGNLWLGSGLGYLVKWESATGQFILMHKFDSFIQCLYVDNRNNIWAGTSTAGAFTINGSNGKISATYTSQGNEGKALLGTAVNEIIQYNDSLFLIASGGLNVLNIHTNSFTYFSKENGLLANSVGNIIRDKRGYVWLTTKLGLCSINIEKQVVTFYDERDGVHTNSFINGSGCLLNDGNIAIATPHDVLVFDPIQANREASKLPPDVTITGFAVMNKWQPMDSINRLPFISLKPDQNSVTIEISTLSYQSVYGFFYMLEGLDKDWNVSPQQNQITYNYLPPGTYTFKVMCKNGDGVISRNISTLKIKVNPVFWKTWWFYSLLVFALITIIYWLDRERMKRKESLEKIRSDIAANLHEEVNTALNNINILSEMARIKADTEPVKSKEYIEQIKNKSHNMIIAMDDMLWSLSPENDSMQKTVERMREYIDALKNRHGVKIDIAVDKKVESQLLNMKLRHEAFLLFKEGIKSIVQAGTKNCRIHIGLNKSDLQFTMEFENAFCDMQQLNNLLHRQDLEKNMKSIGATFNVQVNKTISVFMLLIPFA